jgi:murein DD-endopeptidase MepM/ murein hydrolase activator NlpD
MRRTRLIAIVAVAALCAGLGMSLVAAQTDEIDDAKAQRDEIRARAAEWASALDPLVAENDELEAAVATLTANVEAQEAELEGIRAALAQAERDVVMADEAIADAEAEVSALRDLIRARAVEAFIDPDDGVFEQVLSATDIGEAALRRAFIRSVSISDAELLDELRVAEAEVVDQREAAEAARDEVGLQLAAQADTLAELESSLADQQRLQDALEKRIADYNAEIDALEASDADVTARIQGLIADEEAREAAIAEAARVAAERERLARLQAEQEAARVAAAAQQSLATGEVTVAESTALGAEVFDSVPLPSSAPSVLAWPVGGVVTSPFGPRWGRMHEGIDIGAPTGSSIGAAAGGVVISAGYDGGYGNVVIVDHGGGLVTLYGHMSEILTSTGAQVSTGQQLGTVGCTGSCTGPHVHFETRVNGIPYDPMAYLG